MARPAAIKGTEWQPLIDQLLAAQWSSNVISMYLMARFAYDVDSSTIRKYEKTNRTRIRKDYPDLIAATEERVYVEAHKASDAFVDVIRGMGELIRLQRERLEIDLAIEKNDFHKLLPDTKHEIRLLADLMSQYHELLQDWGVVPSQGIEVNLRLDPGPEEAVENGTTMVLEGKEKARVLSMARDLHEALPRNNDQPNNAH